MRLDGYDVNTSINTILNESKWAEQRTTREAKLEYASRIASVSFGTVGDVAITKQKLEEKMRKKVVASRTDRENCTPFTR